MKTIFHANVDGKEIVLGFGEAHGLIDPVATAIKIAPVLASADETRQMQVLNARINGVRQQAMQAWGLAGAALERKDIPTLTRQNAEYQAKLAEIADLEKGLPDLVRAFEAMRSRVTVDNAVYTHPPQGEDLIADEQAQAMQAKHAASGPGRALLLTGEYVTDLRGREFWLTSPWRHMVIDALGEELPEGALTPELLTDDQRQQIASQQEADRVAGLSADQKAAEAAQAQQAAKTAVTQVQAEVTAGITDKAALTQALAEYKAAVAAISAKYGAALA